MQCEKCCDCDKFENCDEANEVINFSMRILQESDINEFVNNLRKYKKISLEGLGRMINRDKGSVSRIFDGKDNMHFRVSELIIILRYFGYELSIQKFDIPGECYNEEDYRLEQKIMEFEEDIEENFIENK